MGRVKCSFDGEGELIRFTLEMRDGPGGSCAGTLRRSPRAKWIRLIVDERGLTVTVPRSFRFKRDLEPLLEKNLEWILRSFGKVRLRAKRTGEYPTPLPSTITLPALDEVWRVELLPPLSPERQGVGAPRRVFAKDGVICLPQDFTRMEALTALRTWLRLRAKDALPPLLRDLARQQGLDSAGGLARVFVKDMRSRWGSCSSRRNVNLNSRLLFLMPDLVRHVMLHELCHLLEMNHGPKFHERLRAMDIEADRHAAELRAAWQRIPSWASEPL